MEELLCQNMSIGFADGAQSVVAQCVCEARVGKSVEFTIRFIPASILVDVYHRSVPVALDFLLC